MTQAAAPPTLPELAVRVAAIVQAVTGGVMARTARAPAMWFGVLIPMALAILINQWIARRRQRILDLLARIAAGTQRAPRPYRARAVIADDAAKHARKPAARMPRWRGWLITLAQEIRIQGRYLAAVMDEAAMRDAVTAHPQLGRLMMPLLRMLGERRPAWMTAPPTRRQRRRGCERRGAGGGGRMRITAADDPSAALERLVETATETHRRRTAPPPAPPPPRDNVAGGAALPLGFPRFGDGAASAAPPRYGGVFGRRLP